MQKKMLRMIHNQQSPRKFIVSLEVKFIVSVDLFLMF